MSIFNHEQERLQSVLTVIDNKINDLQTASGGVKKDVVHLRKTFWDDVTVNIDHPEDVVESLASIKQQSEMLSERERTHSHFHKQLKTLSRLKDSPYFGRVDFAEDGLDDTTMVYIGTASLKEDTTDQFLIYDWRAPISSLYYDYSPGIAAYDTLDGPIQGTVELKRQFLIKNGMLTSLFDTGVTIGDELLKEVLGNNVNSRMKSIVATIQKEQNRIIRNDKGKYLLVQGVAGSGKTSAALQRVAFLLYQHLNDLTADHIMLFSPNPLFNSYISTVLPELGEENMQQTTFQEYVDKRIGKEIVLESPFAQMEFVLTMQTQPDYQARMNGIRYKASMDYKMMIDRYVSILSKEHLIFKPISFRGQRLISADQIKTYFYSLDQSNSIPNRLQLTARWLNKELRKIEKSEREKEWVLAESELLETEDYTNVHHSLSEKGAFSENSFNDFELERRELAKQIVSTRFKPLRRAVKQLKFLHVKAIYGQLFKPETGLWEELRQFWPNQWELIRIFTLDSIRKNRLCHEDTVAYLYIKENLEGTKTNGSIKHLFIDEAQDYSPFKLAVFKQLFPNSSMTILGDINQAIYAHSINAPTILSKELYEEDLCESFTLSNTYRSTRQIVEFTKHLMAGGQTIKAFNRNGKLPVLSTFLDEYELHEKIFALVGNLEADGHETIAIICKTANESLRAFEQLGRKLSATLIDSSTFSFKKGVLILPTYLAKGIEFDAVIVYNASKEQYESSFDRNLLYTACTRAMHELHLFSIGPKSLFLAQVPTEAYMEK